MIIESNAANLSTGLSPVTTMRIVYDEDLPSGSSSLQENPQNRLAKWLGVLPQIVLASSLVLTTPSLSLPNLPISAPTRLPNFDHLEYRGIERNRHISLHEARKMALQAHREFEEGLQKDRMLEARLISLTQDENEV